MLWAGGPVRLERRCQTTERWFGKHWQRERCLLLLPLLLVLFLNFAAQLFNLSVIPSGSSPLLRLEKRAGVSCSDSAGQATVCPRYSEGSVGTASGRGSRRGYSPENTAPEGLRPPPSPGPQFAFALLLSPPLFTLLHHSLLFPAPTSSLRVSPELCGGAASADSFDLRAVHVVEIRGPAALPSRRSRNGALARENRPLFSAAPSGWTDRWRGEGGAVGGKVHGPKGQR